MPKSHELGRGGQKHLSLSFSQDPCTQGTAPSGALCRRVTWCLVAWPRDSVKSPLPGIPGMGLGGSGSPPTLLPINPVGGSPAPKRLLSWHQLQHPGPWASCSSALLSWPGSQGSQPRKVGAMPGDRSWHGVGQVRGGCGSRSWSPPLHARAWSAGLGGAGVKLESAEGTSGMQNQLGRMEESSEAVRGGCRTPQPPTASPLSSPRPVPKGVHLPEGPQRCLRGAEGQA